MQDREIINDLLGGTKASINCYTTAIVECSNQQLRNALQTLRSEAEQMQYQLYQMAEQKGYYMPAPKANQQDVQKIKSGLSAGVSNNMSSSSSNIYSSGSTSSMNSSSNPSMTSSVNSRMSSLSNQNINISSNPNTSSTDSQGMSTSSTMTNSRSQKVSSAINKPNSKNRH